MRDFVCTWRGEWPKTSMWPLVGFSRPSSSLTVVDLPEPFGPSRPKTSPLRTSKSTLSTARALGRFQKSLNTFVIPRTDTTTSADFLFPVCGCGFGSAGIMGWANLQLWSCNGTKKIRQPGFCRPFWQFQSALHLESNEPDLVQEKSRHDGCRCNLRRQISQMRRDWPVSASGFNRAI